MLVALLHQWLPERSNRPTDREHHITTRAGQVHIVSGTEVLVRSVGVPEQKAATTRRTRKDRGLFGSRTSSSPLFFISIATIGLRQHAKRQRYRDIDNHSGWDARGVATSRLQESCAPRQTKWATFFWLHAKPEHGN